MQGLEERSLPDLSADELRELLADRGTPNRGLAAIVDSLVAACGMSPVDEESLNSIGLLDPETLTPSQLQTLFDAAMTMLASRYDAEPGPVGRYFYNLGHTMMRAGAPPAALVLFSLAVGNPESGYSERADAWEALGNSAWHVGAFHAAGDAYEQQWLLDQENLLAGFNMGESRFWEGDLASAAEIMSVVHIGDETPEVLRDCAALLAAVLQALGEQGTLPVLDGYSGPTPAEMIESLNGGTGDTSDRRAGLTATVISLLEAAAMTGGERLAARAYLTDELEDWVGAAATLLFEGGPAPLLYPVLRKGKSKDPSFASLVQDALFLRGAEMPQEFRKELKYIEGHTYTSHQTVKRLVDESNKVLEEL